MYDLRIFFQKTGRVYVINPENDPDKDKDLVQQLLGKSFDLDELFNPGFDYKQTDWTNLYSHYSYK